MPLGAIDLPRREEVAVRQMWQPKLLARDADEALDMAVPWCDVGITNRPIHSVAIPEIRLEVEIAPPPAGASPEQAASAEVVAANPAELLFGVADVGVFEIVDEEVLGCLTERVILALNRVLVLVELFVATAAMLELPRLEPLRDVVLAVLHVATALDDERAEP